MDLCITHWRQDETLRVRDIKGIMNYRRVMRQAEEELKTRPFSLNLLKELHMDEQSRENARKAQAIIDLYDRMKSGIIELTHSRYAVPLLDCLFDQPVFTSSLFDDRPGMPGKPMITNQSCSVAVFKPFTAR